MIERAITSKDLKSKYYRHNERLASVWEKFTEEQNGNIEGIVNSFILEFNLTWKISATDINVKGLRQLSSNKAGIHYDYLITKNTIIEVKPVRPKYNDYKIVQKEFLGFFNKLFQNHRRLTYNDNFELISKKRIVDKDIIDSESFDFFSKLSDLRSIKFEKSIVSIEFYNLLGIENLTKLIEYLKKNYAT